MNPGIHVMRGLIEWNGRGSRLVAGVLMGLAWMGSLSAPLYAQQFAHIDQLFFSKGYGGPNPLPQVLTVTSTGAAFGFTASAGTSTGGDWLAVSPTGDCCTTPARVSVIVNADAALAVGSYSGKVVFTGGDTSLTVNVTLVVAPSGGPVFDSTPGQLSFSMTPGGQATPQVMQVANAGTGTLNWRLIGSAFNGASFLSVSAQTGTGPTQVTVGILPENLPNGGATPGVYTGQLLFLAAGSTVTVPVSVSVGDADADASTSLRLAKTSPDARMSPSSGTVNLYPANTINVVCSGFNNTNAGYSGYTAAPDGTQTGLQVYDANPGNGLALHDVYLYQPFYAVNNVATQYTLSFHFKAGNSSWVYIRSDVNGATQRVWFNLAGNGAVGTTLPAGWSAGISAVPGAAGWYRAFVTFTVTAIATNSGFGLATADNQVNFVGTNGGASIYEWGQQLESGVTLSAYQPNVGPCMNFSKAADAHSVPAGSSIGYTVYLSNNAAPGTGAATAAAVNDPLRPGTGINWSISPAYSGPGTCAVTGAIGSQTLVCNFGDVAGGVATSVHVTSGTSASSCGVYPNTAYLSANNISSLNVSDTATVTCTGLGISKTHTGNFTQGQTGATYSVTVLNGGAAPTSGTVTVTETVPTGLTLVSMAGTGWTCPGTAANNCTRSDVLAAGASYLPITVTVNVAANAPSSVSNQVSVSGGGSATANASDPTLINASGGTATAAFVKTDTTAQGTWKGVYGADGEAINGDTTSYPSYAQVSFNGGPFVWVASTADVRALQKVAASDRIASGWYSWTNMSIDVNLTDGNAHQVALYCLDWDAGARAERIDVLDAVSNAVLDTRTISGFQGGQYLVWNLKGHVKLNVTLTGGSNAVVNGLFFGTSSGTATAAFVKTDTTAQGTWKGVYGADGGVINGDTASYPSYAQVSFNGSPFVWVPSTADVRGLQKFAASDRIASGWYSFTNMTIDVNLTDANSHQVALYCLDWDGGGARAERIDVLDASSNSVLDTRTISGFQNGQYLVWNLTGHVKLKITLTGGANAVVSGLFFGTPSGTAAATFVKTDTTAQGTWKGVYGADGEAINGDTTSYPSYGQVNFSGGNPFVWVPSTADVRGLQKVAASDRIASGWYSFTNMTIDVNLTDGNTHQVALYCLDWDGGGARAERIDVLDAASNAVLDTRTISGFQNGQYLVWNLKGHVKLKITVTGGANAVVSGLFFGASSVTATAAFVRTDTTAQGTWKGVYGADGEAINGDTTSYPSYGQVNFSGGNPFVWVPSTADVRALQKVAASDRIASGWYSFTNMSIDVNLTDTNSHQVALYCLDWDGGGARAERIDVLDAVSNAVLDTRTVSSFQNGQYLVWSLTGHVKLKITLTGGANAVVSGLFFR
jgi:uncharacterized repeat protein (TIGR01451 family)